MIDEAGAAPAAAEPVAAPEAPPPPAEPGAPTPVERSKEPARASIDRAFAQLDKQDKAAAAPKEAKEPKEQVPATQEARERDESGRFKAKEATAEPAPIEVKPPEAKVVPVEKPATVVHEPPSRFSADAKAAWATAPDPVKAEVNRAIKELEGGISQYKQVLEPLKKHLTLAQQHGTTVHDALDGYISVERALRGQDVSQKLTALEGIFETAGISPRDYAAHIMGQKPDEVSSRTDAVIRQQNAKIAELEQKLGGFSRSLEERRLNDTNAQVAEFAKDHPRLNDQEFANTVGKLIQGGLADDLKAAYDMADRLNPAPQPEPSPAAPAAATPKPNTDQTRKGTLSIGGAPTGGSNPLTRKPAQTRGEALSRAFATMGIT